MTPEPLTADRADALVERLFGATLGALELFSVYLGVELGLYRTLERDGALTPDELAERAGIDPRYAREWLEQQAVAGLLEVVDAPSRRCALTADHARVLCHEDDPAHIAPFAHMLAGIGGVLPRVAQAYRTGGGVPYEAYGVEFRHGQGHINRPAFTNELPGDWLEAMPDVAARLREPGARVADVGCGQGWASVAVARAYPAVRVDGVDADPASIADARRHAGDADVDDRVRFAEGDAAALTGGPYDLVLILETLHDLPQPVEALRAARAATAPGGTVLVVDERVADTFTAPGDEVERTMYGWSVTHCLPTQMVDRPSAALGTVLRADTVRECAFEAGYAGVEVLDVENDFFRLYRLNP
jgi:SAM-dependent methyltransferase